MINIYDDLGNRNDRAVWYITPSHAYLKVLVSGVLHSGFKPSKYSIQQGDDYYLEEDCDAISYLTALHGNKWQQHQRKIPESMHDQEIEDILKILTEKNGGRYYD